MTALTILAYILISLGLILALIPLFPGPLLIWLGTLCWAWADGFQRITWPELYVLAGIAVLAMTSDIIATLVSGRRAGVGWRTMGAAILGGLTGAIVFSVIPLWGTLLGAVAGVIGGVLLAEYAKTHDWSQAWKSAKVFLVSFLIGRALEFTLDLVLLGVFVWMMGR